MVSALKISALRLGEGVQIPALGSTEDGNHSCSLHTAQTSIPDFSTGRPRRDVESAGAVGPDGFPVRIGTVRVRTCRCGGVIGP